MSTHVRSSIIIIIIITAADQSQTNHGVDRNHNSNEVPAIGGVTEVSQKPENVKKVKKETGNVDRAAAGALKSETNPLKKYAPVSMPGWEVNIIYKPSRNLNARVPAHTNVSRNVATEVPFPTTVDSNITSEVEHTLKDSRDVVRLIDNMEDYEESLGDDVERKGDKSVFWKPVFAVQRLMKRIKGAGRNQGGNQAENSGVQN